MRKPRPLLWRKGWWICWSCVTLYILSGWQKLHKLQQNKCNVLHMVEKKPLKECKLEKGWGGSSSAGQDLGWWCWTRISSAPLRQWKLTTCQAALAREQPAVGGQWLFPSNWHFWGHVWYTVSCPVLSSPVKGIGNLSLDQWRATRTVVQGSQGWDGETGFG